MPSSAERRPWSRPLCLVLLASVGVYAANEGSRPINASLSAEGLQLSATNLLSPDTSTMRAAGILLRLLGDERTPGAGAAYLRRAGLGQPCRTCPSASARTTGTDAEVEVVIELSRRHYQALAALDSRAREAWSNRSLSDAQRRAALTQLQHAKETQFTAFAQDLARSLPSDASVALEEFIATHMKPRIRHGQVQ